MWKILIVNIKFYPTFVLLLNFIIVIFTFLFFLLYMYVCIYVYVHVCIFVFVHVCMKKISGEENLKKKKRKK